MEEPNFTKIIINTKCDKCGKSDCILDRHHIGNEKKILRICSDPLFEDHEFLSSLSFKRFKDRYEAFKEKDIRRLCRECHEDVHKFYKRKRVATWLWLWKMDFYDNPSLKLINEFKKYYTRIYFLWKDGKNKL